MLAIKQSKEQDMLNILSSQGIDESELSETNKQLETNLKASKNNEKLKDEVSLYIPLQIHIDYH